MNRRELIVALKRPGAVLHYGLEDVGIGKWPHWWLEPSGVNIDAGLAKAILPALTPIEDSLIPGAPPQSYIHPKRRTAKPGRKRR